MTTLDHVPPKLARRDPTERIQLGFILAAVLVPTCVPRLALWPVALTPLVLLFAAAARRNPALRKAPPWLKPGRLDVNTVLVTAAVTVVSCGALLVWKRLADPDLSDYVARVPSGSTTALIVAGATFALVNAFVEEAVFRGLLQTLFRERYSLLFTLITQAVLFGIGHYSGVPRGMLGVAMATMYGLALGMIRHWSGGIAACTLSHIVADATIFSMIVWDL